MLEKMIGKKCVKGFEVVVKRSPAGYYIGTEDIEGDTNCRLSSYGKSSTDLNKMITRDCVENNYCNGGRGCFR